MDVGRMQIGDYLGKAFECSCGRVHSVELDTVEISVGALAKVANIIRKNGFTKPFIIADSNTHLVAGQELLENLERENVRFSSFVFEDADLIPNEHALGNLVMNYDSECDLIIGVGAGTINDISRFFSHLLNIPYFVVATAPSMDGYASTVAPLIKNNNKVTYEGQMPRAIIADLAVVANAPQEMIAAGFSDMVGKFTCLADWKLSAIINDEYYCDRIVRMTRQALDKTIALRHGVANREPRAIAKLMEALVVSGIAMSYAGNSRPASGSEHHLSHFWEIRFMLEGKKPVLHGIKVGIGTVLVSRLYQLLSKEALDADSIVATVAPSNAYWEKSIKEVFMEAAPEVLQLETKALKNAVAGWKERIPVIAVRWDEIREVLKSVPSTDTIIRLINDIGGVVKPEDVAIDDELVRQGLLYAKEIRPRYTILQLLWDLDSLHDYAIRLTERQNVEK